MAFPSLDLTDLQTKTIFDEIDSDCSGFIDKQEMEKFILTIMMKQRNLTFKKSDVIVDMLGNSITKSIQDKKRILKKNIEISLRKNMTNKIK